MSYCSIVLSCRAVLSMWKGELGPEGGGDAPPISKQAKNVIYSLATEKLPQLISYMTKIKAFKQGW